MSLSNLHTDQIHKLMLKAVSEGRIPPPDGYAADGSRPVWSIEALAAFFGKSPQQIEAALADTFEDLADAVWTGPVGHVQ